MVVQDTAKISEAFRFALYCDRCLFMARPSIAGDFPASDGGFQRNPGHLQGRDRPTISY